MKLKGGNVMKKNYIIFVVLCFVLFTGCIERDTIAPLSVKASSLGNLAANDWISSSTEFSFIVTDSGSGVNATYYRIWFNGSWYNWIVYTGPFTLSGEGMHYLEYYSVDNAGNIEATHNQTHYVDDTPPETEKIIGEAMVVYASLLVIDLQYPAVLNCSKLVISPEYDYTIYCGKANIGEMVL